MALTKEQANKIKVTRDTPLGDLCSFEGAHHSIYGDDLAKWAYRRIETWPDLLHCIQEILPVIKCLKQSEIYESWISQAEQIVASHTT